MVESRNAEGDVAVKTRIAIVMTALAGGIGKVDGHAYFRPWLQTWAIDEAQQRVIQSSVSDLGMGWLLWSNESNYSRAALPPR